MWVVDRIQLEAMSFRGRHGVRPAEREQAQEFLVDVEVECDLRKASRTDDIADTIDYRAIHAIAKEVVEGEPQKLIETLAGRIADRVLQIPGVQKTSVRVAKKPASMQPIGDAAVHISRTRA